ncbi:MAG: Hpt protein [Pseudarthrobacter sp.]|nr:Hpt protein [Pseudarthrobacter sp.]
MQSPDPGSSDRGAAAEPPQPGITATTGSAFSQEAAGLLPLVDAAVLEELEDELAGSGLGQRFARDYAAMWDQRCARLAAAVHNQDMDSALDAAISLKISSAMVGGVRLAKLAELLETLIRQGEFGQGKVLMERVAQDGGQTVSELESTYILKNG